MSRADIRILCDMCKSDYPQVADIMATFKAKPFLIKAMDPYGMNALQYLAMNKKIDTLTFDELISVAPKVKAEYEGM